MAATLAVRAETAKEPEKPLPSVFDPAAIDPNVKPCSDFYQYGLRRVAEDEPGSIRPDRALLFELCPGWCENNTEESAGEDAQD
jgi:hypothetical protein